MKMLSVGGFHVCVCPGRSVYSGSCCQSVNTEGGGVHQEEEEEEEEEKTCVQYCVTTLLAPLLLTFEPKL